MTEETKLVIIKQLNEVINIIELKKRYGIPYICLILDNLQYIPKVDYSETITWFHSQQPTETLNSDFYDKERMADPFGAWWPFMDREIRIKFLKHLIDKLKI